MDIYMWELDPESLLHLFTIKPKYLITIPDILFSENVKNLLG